MTFKKLLTFAYYASCSALLGISFSAEGQTFTAKQNATTPSGSSGIAFPYCFSINNKIYLGGGYVGSFTNTKDFYEYNPSSNTWVKKADLPNGANRSAGIAFVANGKAYIGLGAIDHLSLSGATLLSDLWEYNPTTNQWTQKAALPDSGRAESSCFVIGNKAYVAGGNVTATGWSTNDLWEYDAVSNSWASKAAYPGGPISGAAAFSQNSKGYVVSGFVNYQRSQRNYEYNPSGNIWALKDSLPGAARSGAIGFDLNGKGYVGLGAGNTNTYPQDFYAYNAVSNSWGAAISFAQQGRANGAAAIANNKAYLGLGWRPGMSATYFKDWFEFNPSTTNINALNELVFRVYPNPTRDVLHLQVGSNGNWKCELFGMSGQRIKQVLFEGSCSLNIANLPNGMYMAVVSNGELTSSIPILKE